MADEYVISVVLEGKSGSLTSATKKGADAQGNLEKRTQAANIAFLAQVARYQAMTAALNQTIGGLNKLAGGLEAIGFEKQAEMTRQFTKYLELVAGPAEIYLAYLTLSIAMGQKDIATKAGQKAATDGLTKSTTGLNAAMAANPMVLIALSIVAVVAMLYILERETGKVTAVIEGLNKALRDLIETFTSLGGLLDDNPLRKLVESDTMAGINNALRLESLGVG